MGADRDSVYYVVQMLPGCQKDEGKGVRRITDTHLLYWDIDFGDIKLARVGRLSAGKWLLGLHGRRGSCLQHATYILL